MISTATTASLIPSVSVTGLAKLAPPAMKAIIPTIPGVGVAAKVLEVAAPHGLAAASKVVGPKHQGSIDTIKNVAEIVSHASSLSHLIPAPLKKIGLMAMMKGTQIVGSLISAGLSAIKFTQVGVAVAAGVAAVCAIGKYFYDRAKLKPKQEVDKLASSVVTLEPAV